VALKISFPIEGDHCPGVWGTLWDAGEEVFAVAQNMIGCLGEEP